jgi:hypothetical protein
LPVLSIGIESHLQMGEKSVLVGQNSLIALES